MHPALRQLDHRPWPVPGHAWSWRQNWHDLLFAHWPLPAGSLRPLIPEGLAIQEYDGTAWIGVVPFRMTGVMRRPLPDMPWLSAFPELNLRTYVEHDGKPGVWFLSLDASNRLACWAARRYFHLPYWHARMTFTHAADTYRLHSLRDRATLPVEVSAIYRPASTPYLAQRGTLEHFLTERYCLYTRSPAGSLYRCEVHHAPWPLQKADGEVNATTLLQPHGLTLPSQPPLLHFSPGLRVVVWPLEKLTGYR